MQPIVNGVTGLNVLPHVGTGRESEIVHVITLLLLITGVCAYWKVARQEPVMKHNDLAVMKKSVQLMEVGARGAIGVHAPNHVEVVYKNEVLTVFKRYDMELTTSFKSIIDFVRLLLRLLMNIATS